MFSVPPQNPNSQASFQSKRETFRNQIRKQKLQNYQKNLRHKFLYRNNQVDGNVLKNISLTQVLDTILKYNSPQNNSNSNQDICIDDVCYNFDIELPENAAIFKAIEGLFLHATSSNLSHVLNILEERHIMALVEIIEHKCIQIKPQFRQKSYKQGKTANDLRLPQIYERIIIILAQCAFGEALFFEESIQYIVYVVNQILTVFPRHSRVVQACIRMIGASFNNKTLANHLLFLLSDTESSKCLLSKILDIVEHQVQFFEEGNEHSNKIVMSVIYFYNQFFTHFIYSDLYPNMRTKIFEIFQQLLKKNLNDKMVFEYVEMIKSLYNPDFGNVCQTVLESKPLYVWILKTLKRTLKMMKSKDAEQKFEEKVHLCHHLLETVKEVFDSSDPEDELFTDTADFLSDSYDAYLDIILQDGLKSLYTPVVTHTLRLIKSICNWGDFIEKVYENGNITVKLFYYSRSENFSLKKQAILCLCNILDGYFDGKSFHDSELCEMYDALMERFDFLDIMVVNLDTYADLELNVEILNIAKIMCYFWQSDPELGKYNKFWHKFVENGGELKLNAIVDPNSDRNPRMKELAELILDEFVVTEEYEI